MVGEVRERLGRRPPAALLVVEAGLVQDVAVVAVVLYFVCETGEKGGEVRASGVRGGAWKGGAAEQGVLQCFRCFERLPAAGPAPSTFEAKSRRVGS